MLGIPIGLAVFGCGEWALHKYLLHGLGRDRTSRFAFHYHDHHQAVRRHGGYDPAYEGPVWSTTTPRRSSCPDRPCGGRSATARDRAPTPDRGGRGDGCGGSEPGSTRSWR